MKRKVKQYFNMLEIALAIAIIALGVTSIMALFPVGLSSTKATIADNTIPDAAEYFLGYLEAVTQANWQNSSGTMITNSFLNIIPEEKPTGDPSVNFAASELFLTGSGLYKSTDSNHVFKYERKVKINSVDVSEFAAVAVIWKEPIFFRKPGDTGLIPLLSDKDESYKRAVALCVEFSWPIERVYAAREKRVYRLELFNVAGTPPSSVGP